MGLWSKKLMKPVRLSCELYASLAGGVVILILGTIDVELAIAIQCLANLFMGLTDLRARKLLIKE